MFLKNTSINKLFIGATSVEKVYLGNNKVWPLTYDAEVEYLQSTGTQWIDTGYQPTTTTDAMIKFTATQNGNSWVMGTITWWGVRCYFDTTPKQVEFANSSVVFSRAGVAYTQGDVVTLSLQGSEVFADGTKIGEITRNNASGNLAIFGYQGKNGTANLLIPGRVYFVKLWQDGNLIRDFIPVRVGSSGYLYDKVSGSLFGNQGSGSFILGPDKS